MQPDADTGMTGSNTEDLAFEIKSTDITLPAGQEFTKCFYFHTSNTDTAIVNKWVSDLTPGSHHMIMFLNPGGSQPADGTIDENCGIGGSSNIPVWTFATQSPHLEEDLPTDDGNGKPLAQNIPANTAGFLQMHYLNATDSDLTVHVDLKAYSLPANTPYTQTDAYITYIYNFTVPPGTSTATGTCSTPAGAKFWQVSSHSHKQSIDVKINDGSSMVLDSTDWEHPAAKSWNSPFYSFASNSVNWACTYNNPTATTIHEGQSAQTNEMCMMTGYYFPATGPLFNIAIGSGGSCITR